MGASPMTPQGPMGGPGRGNNGNNPFLTPLNPRNSRNNGQRNNNNKGNNDGNDGKDGNNKSRRPIWQSPWTWIVLLVLLAVVGFQMFAKTGSQTIDTQDGIELLRSHKANYAEIIDNKQLVKLTLDKKFSKYSKRDK